MEGVTDVQKTICDILGVKPGEKFRYICENGNASEEKFEVSKTGIVHSQRGPSDSLPPAVFYDLINNPQYIIRADGSHPPVPDYKFDKNFLPIPRICEILGVRPGEFFEIRGENGESFKQMINIWGHTAMSPYWQCTTMFDREKYTLHQGEPQEITKEEAQRAVQAILKHKFTEECHHKSPPDFIVSWLKKGIKCNSLFTPLQVGVFTRTLYLSDKIHKNLDSDRWFQRGVNPDMLESCINKIIYENATPKEREQLISEAKAEINEYVKSNAGNIKGQHIMALMSETDNPNWDDVFAVRQEIHQLDRCRFAERELHLNKEQPNKNSMVR